MKDGKTKHTLFVANDNDFLATIADPLKSPGDSTRGLVPNPNKFFVFAFDATDLDGYAPERFRDDRGCSDGDCSH